MADITPGPRDPRNRIPDPNDPRRLSDVDRVSDTSPLNDDIRTTPAAARSSGGTIAGVLLVIGLILLGLMFLTPARTPTVNNPVPNPTGTATVPSTATTGSSTGTVGTTTPPGNTTTTTTTPATPTTPR